MHNLRFIWLFIVFENVKKSTESHIIDRKENVEGGGREHVDIYYGQFKYPTENVCLFFPWSAVYYCPCSHIDNSFLLNEPGRGAVASEHHINIHSSGGTLCFQ